MFCFLFYKRMWTVIVLPLLFMIGCGQFDGPRGVPEFSMVLTDTTKTFNSKDIPEGKPIMIVWFDPNCKDCQKETEHLLADMNSYSDVKIYMVTSHSHKELMVFYKHLRLDTCRNILVGIDTAITIPKQYRINEIPITLVYDAKKKFKAGFTGVPDFEKLKETIHQSKI